MKVTIRCPFCRHIHAAYDHSDLYVFVPETLKKWANSECPTCHRIGYEILIEAVGHELVCRLVNGKFLLRDTTGKYAGVMAVGDSVDEALAKHIKYWITE